MCFVHDGKAYKCYDMLLVLFVVVFLLSNIASAAKVIDIKLSFFNMPILISAGTIIFPITYIMGDIVTEVYGYARLRRMVWLACFAALFTSLFLTVVSWMPGDSSHTTTEAFDQIFGGVLKGGIMIASLVGFFLGELSNSYVLAKMKVGMQGKHLWWRIIGSSLVGQAIDTVLFIGIACIFGVFSWNIAVSLIVSLFVIKVLYEAILVPVTYHVAWYLKRKEHEDFYDKKTNFNPFYF